MDNLIDLPNILEVAIDMNTIDEENHAGWKYYL
jgi:hypothetical protein